MFKIKSFTLRSLADGQVLFVQPTTPCGMIRQAFHADPELKFVAMQKADGRLAVIRRPDLPVAFFAPVGEVTVGKLPLVPNNEWRFGDVQNRFVYTTQPVAVENVEPWLNQFETFVQTIDQTEVGKLLDGSIQFTLEIESGKAMFPGYETKTLKAEKFGQPNRVPTSVREPVTA